MVGEASRQRNGASDEALSANRPEKVDGVIVATNFTFQRVQPSKERAYPGYEFWGEIDGTREVPEDFSQDEAKWRISMMFNLAGRFRINDQQRPFHVGSLPPWLTSLFFVSFVPMSVVMYSFMFLKIHG